MGQIIRRVGFFLHQITAVFFVAQNAQDDGFRPARDASARRHALLAQALRNRVRAQTLTGIQRKNAPHNRRALRLDGHHAAAHLIAQQTASEYHAALHTALLSPLHPLRGAPAFLLRDTGQNGQPQLGIRLQRIQPVIDEPHAHAQPAQLPRILQRIHGIARKAADLLGHNQIKLPLSRPFDHAQKLDASCRARAGQAFVGKDFHESPVRMIPDILRKITLLAFKRMPLILTVGGNPAVHCDTLHRHLLPSAASYESRLRPSPFFLLFLFPIGKETEKTARAFPLIFT